MIVVLKAILIGVLVFIGCNFILPYGWAVFIGFICGALYFSNRYDGV